MTDSVVRIYTVGHGARSLTDFQGILLDAGIARLVDVRRYPGSRRHPHFSREQLEPGLRSVSVGYEWAGDALGGRRETVPDSRHIAWRNDAFRGYADLMDTPEFREALVDVEREARKQTTAIMCAETLWWRCHRRLISDALTLRGDEVMHILDLGKAEPHKLHPQVRTDENGWPIYDVGETPTLL